MKIQTGVFRKCYTYMLSILMFLVIFFSSCGQSQEEVRTPEAQPEPGTFNHSTFRLKILEGNFSFMTKDDIPLLLQTMSLEEKIGQLLLAQIRYLDDGSALRQLDQRTSEYLDYIQPGGIIFFAENIYSIPQVVGLIEDVIKITDFPPLLAVDEEGGTVSRLTRSGFIDAPKLPSAQSLGKIGDEELVRQMMFEVGQSLAILGFNTNLAPVADIHSINSNPITKYRSFSSNPQLVADLVSAAVGGLNDAGIISILKHFPGHGGTTEDSHFDLPIVSLSREELLNRELVPFRAGIDAGAKGLMSAHLVFPKISGKKIPASLSLEFNQNIAKQELHHSGIIIADALEMDGITDIMPSEDAAVLAIRSGADMIIPPIDPIPIFEALRRAIWLSELSIDRVNNAVARILRVKMDSGHWINDQFPSVEKAEAFFINTQFTRAN